MKNAIIITTINDETEAIRKLSSHSDWHVVIVGDFKSKHIKSRANLTFLSIEDQKKLGYNCLKNMPFNHYCRKNIGYLFAIQNGAELVYDTDDDNIPYDDWNSASFIMQKKIRTKSNYLNIYNLFTDENIWPRGFPLMEILNNSVYQLESGNFEVGIIQALADLDPDVDAIYRLVNGNKITFNKNIEFALDQHIYAPINSQSTYWQKNVFPLLYLPSSVTFRFTDILRGYIALRLVWEQNLLVGFCSPKVYQERNYHNIMKDFNDEIPMYQCIDKVVKILSEIKFSNDSVSNLFKVYEMLSQENIVGLEELASVKAWIMDIQRAYK